MLDIVVSEPLLKDIARQLRVDSVFEWLENEADKLAALGLDGRGSAVSFAPKLLAARQVRKLYETDTTEPHAYIEAVGDGFAVGYSSELPMARQRFSVAHELGHTYFFRPEHGCEPLSGIQKFSFLDETIESLCDYFARALLLPKRSIVGALHEHGIKVARDAIPPIHLAPILARRFNVAEQAVIRRLVFDIYKLPITLVCIVMRRGNHANEWVTSWSVSPAKTVSGIPSSGWKLPLASARRVIPYDMVPIIPEGTAEGTTSLIAVDSRWWEATRPQPISLAKRPFSRWMSGESVSAFVTKYAKGADLFSPEKNTLVLGVTD